MTIVRLPFAQSTNASVTDSLSTQYNAASSNAIIERDTSGEPYITQRKGLVFTGLSGDANTNSEDTTFSGRGIYFWEKQNTFVTVSGSVVSLGYGLPVGDIDDGAERVYIEELGDYLVIIDAENNKGWYISEKNLLTIVEITDADFPPNIGSGLELAGGVVALDGYMFVLTTSGVIYQSEINNPTSWNALDFLSAEREPDKGVFICKHLGHVAVLGSKTLEFFYNAGNVEGSILTRRSDVFYNTGSVDRISAYQAGDRIVFLGGDGTGSMGLYLVESFQLIKKSKHWLDIELTALARNNNARTLVTAMAQDDHFYIYMTSVREVSGEEASTGGPIEEF